MSLEKAETVSLQVHLLHLLTSNSYQNDQFHSQLCTKDYEEYCKNMPTFPCFTEGQSPVKYARDFCDILTKISPYKQQSVYFVFWLHNYLVKRPLYFVDKIDESIFGGEPHNPRLARPKSAISAHNKSFYDERQEFYLTGFNTDLDPKDIQLGIKMIIRETYSILARTRTMNLFIGKIMYVKSVSMTTLELEIHTIGACMQYGIQNALQDYFTAKNPRVLSVFHLGQDVPEAELAELAKSASQH